jgi:hypothetical protein
MGEAKRRQLAGTGEVIVYHHTSTLRTNLIWMSGVIDLEGLSRPVLHPQMGEIRNDALARRELKDFTRLAWFTTQMTVPEALVQTRIQFIDKNTGLGLPRALRAWRDPSPAAHRAMRVDVSPSGRGERHSLHPEFVTV